MTKKDTFGKAGIRAKITDNWWDPTENVLIWALLPFKISIILCLVNFLFHDIPSGAYINHALNETPYIPILAQLWFGIKKCRDQCTFMRINFQVSNISPDH